MIHEEIEVGGVYIVNEDKPLGTLLELDEQVEVIGTLASGFHNVSNNFKVKSKKEDAPNLTWILSAQYLDPLPVEAEDQNG